MPEGSAPDPEAELIVPVEERIRSEESLLELGEETAAAPVRTSAFVILRMVLVLALVAGVIYFVVFFLRKISRPQTEQNPHLKILASTHLGSSRYVHVVSVGSKAWLIGSGEGGVTHIADIDDGEALDAMLLDSSRRTAENTVLPGFQALLRRFTGKESIAGGSKGPGGPGPLERRIEELRELRELREQRDRFKR